MPAWPFHSRNSSPVKKWADEVVDPEACNEDKAQFHTQKESHEMTPTTSTAVEYSLPAPIAQGEGYSLSSSRRRKCKTRYHQLQRIWDDFKHRISSGTAPSSSSINEETAADDSHTYRIQGGDALDDDELDEIVVDRNWSEEFHTTLSNSDRDMTSPEKSGSHNHPSGNTDNASTNYDHGSPSAIEILLIQARHGFMEVFSSRFADERKERHYAQEDWFVKKPLAVVTSIWWISNWILGCIFIRLTGDQFLLADKIFYLGIAPALTIPVVLMVMYDWPRDRQYIYQGFLILSIWCWSFYHVIFMNLCGFYKPGPNTCHDRDFLATFYYTTVMQTIGFFALKLNRFPAAIGALAYLLLACITIVPDRRTWIRSMINFFVFHAFLIYVHYMREGSERRLYTLRDQLKVQFKATQRAQMNERKASDSKRRLTSYVFHEVRVPLNTALLAVQNMAASGTVAKDQEIEFNALSGSLSMMSKVLNDVLDFNRMDSGKFESASRPYAFHQVMRSLFIPLRLATDARGLEFETDLDLNVDRMARALAYDAMGESVEAIRHHILEHPDVDGIVVGDEARLRQIVTNLASNACKFTPPGGKMTITTKLVRPHLDKEEDPLSFVFPGPADDNSSAQRPLSADYLSQHNFNTTNDKLPLESIVVRIEVTDTGYGIKAQDMANSKLFSAFNQTEQGIQQGGKGTGLGLALVRQIVMLTGGRLGVKSKIGGGSTFWVELPLGVGRRTFTANGPPLVPDTSSPPSDSSASANQTHHGSFEASWHSPLDVAGDNAVRASSSPPTKMDLEGQVEEAGSPLDQVQLTPQTVTHRKRDSSQDTTGTGRHTIETVSRFETPRPKHSLHESITIQEPISSEPEHEALTPTQNNGRELARTNRPTFVPLPSPPKFIEGGLLENQPPFTSSTISSSNSSHSNALAAFDNAFAHYGSPTSSSQAVDKLTALNVLVVDDDPLTRTLMTRILTRLGCQVTTAENGEMAVDLVMGSKGWSGLTPSSDTSRQSGPILEQPGRSLEPGPDTLGQIPDEMKFAVVFLDNQMPVMSGIRAVQRLRQLGRKDFVVGVTGNALLSDQREYLDAGVDRILTKPVLERSLREILVIAEERCKLSNSSTGNSNASTS